MQNDILLGTYPVSDITSMDFPDSADDFDASLPIPNDDDLTWMLEGCNETSPERSNSPETSNSSLQFAHDGEPSCSMPHSENPLPALSGSTQEHRIPPVSPKLRSGSPTPSQQLDDLPSPDVTLTDPASEGRLEAQPGTTATATCPPSRLSNTRRRYGPEKWETIRPVLYDLYILQGNSLFHTRKLLEEERGFIAS